MIDLHPLHDLISTLPLETEDDNIAVRDTLDAIHGAWFHAISPMRAAIARKWLAEHPELAPKAFNLMKALGLASEPLKRRF